MKNLYKKGKVHPSSSPPRSTISDRLALLPATILTLTVALSPQDREVLAYLISSCSNNTSSNFSSGHPKPTSHISSSNNNTSTTTNGGGGGGGGDGEHGTRFYCDCFRCYMSYWVRWDTSPNRQLIHEIIDAYEEGLFDQNKKKKNMKNKKQRKRRVVYHGGGEGDNISFKENLSVTNESMVELESIQVPGCGSGGGGGGGGGDEVVGLEKGSVRKIVSFIGEKIWGAWSK